ncbi:hypothetical protein [Secundilactobacillus collinoides]|uniref:Phage protein n=3 Tax=Secundilactobacillus collinoides TaxID=33960 RepID=A0A0R2B4P9_SECCO|nr:hypothetical protein [Secundilactobacillus collinoides]KRM74493.1 hypothetical protein FC82_GL000121 [Secundilactobacillus collinoides DSM 20515 = JCM 1123]KZL35681.1 hypothetical protein TY91_15930 [Secundilactobacillus collinoides]
MSKIQAIKIGKALVYGFKPTSQLTFIKEEVGKRTLNGKEIAYVKMPKQIQIEVVLPYGSEMINAINHENGMPVEVFTEDGIRYHVGGTFLGHDRIDDNEICFELVGSDYQVIE